MATSERVLVAYVFSYEVSCFTCPWNPDAFPHSLSPIFGRVESLKAFFRDILPVLRWNLCFYIYPQLSAPISLASELSTSDGILFFYFLMDPYFAHDVFLVIRLYKIFFLIMEKILGNFELCSSRDPLIMNICKANLFYCLQVCFCVLLLTSVLPVLRYFYPCFSFEFPYLPGCWLPSTQVGWFCY